MVVTKQRDDERMEVYSEDVIKTDETTITTPKWKKYVLPFLGVGILIFSCIVIGLYFLSQFI